MQNNRVQLPSTYRISYADIWDDPIMLKHYKSFSRISYTWVTHLDLYLVDETVLKFRDSVIVSSIINILLKFEFNSISDLENAIELITSECPTFFSKNDGRNYDIGDIQLFAFLLAERAPWFPCRWILQRWDRLRIEFESAVIVSSYMPIEAGDNFKDLALDNYIDDAQFWVYLSGAFLSVKIASNMKDNIIRHLLVL